MQNQYPNIFYEQLSQMIISNPSIALKNGEVCFYQGEAKSYKVISQIKETPKKKTSLLLTPWFVGVKRKTNVEVKQETKNEYYKGQLYITNMRMVFRCQVDAFDIMIPSITSINQHRDGIRVISGVNSYDVMTSDVKQVLHIIDLMNKAQTAPNNSAPSTTATASAKTSLSRNDNYAIAAFIHYCEFGGKPIAKKNDVYPSYFTYDFNINNPAKYHQKVVDEGYLEEAPISISLQQLKVDQLKQILVSNGLSDKGKKDALIQRIVDEVDTASLNLEKVYIPTDKGWEHLKRYDYLFKVKKYGIRFDEYEAQQKKMQSTRSNDVIWQILNAKFNEYNMARDFGLARNELYNIALLLAEEEKQTDALMHYVLVLYYDMSGCANGGRIESKADLCLAPAITKAIYDRKEHYTTEMLDRCYDRYNLPHHYFSKSAFGKLLNMIFEDETIDLLTF